MNTILNDMYIRDDEQNKIDVWFGHYISLFIVNTYKSMFIHK